MSVGLDHPEFNAPRPNSDDPFAAKRAEIDAALAKFMDGADIHTARDTLNEDTAARANDFLAGAKKLLREAEDACTRERAPHMAAAKAVSQTWAPIVSRLEKIIALVGPKLDAYLKAKQAAQRKAAEEAARKQREAEDAARRAAAEAAAAENASARIAADEQAEAQERIAAEHAAKAQRLSAPARVQSATGLTNTRSLRTVYSARIVSLPQALAHYAKHQDVAALILQLANAELRHAPVVAGVKQIPAIPGVTFDKDQVL